MINVKDLLTMDNLDDLVGKYLIVQTLEDGYTGTYTGNYIYKFDSGLLGTGVEAIFPTKWNKDLNEWSVDSDPSEPYNERQTNNPVVLSVSEEESFIAEDGTKERGVKAVGTFITRNKVPYQPYTVMESKVIEENSPTRTLELRKNMLQLFLSFAEQEYSLGNYNVFLTDEIKTDYVAPIKATKVILDKSTLSLVVGAKGTISYTLEPTNTDEDAMLVLTDKTLATVSKKSANTFEITAKKAGTTTLTATAGEVSATCELTVTAE